MATRSCEGCDFDISGHAPHLRECYSCRVTTLLPKQCDACGEGHHRRMSRHCQPCAQARWIFSDYASGRHLAAYEVSVARRHKRLAPPARYACQDCGGPANSYDHRDYNEPLTVDPVCRGCNIRRGSAIPKRWSFEEFAAWASNLRRPHSRLRDADVMERLRRNHFTGPGGVAVAPLRTRRAA